MKWLLVVAVPALCLPLAGQAGTPVTPKQGTSDQARVEQRAQSMREHIDTGRPIQSHVRVAVRLKNGNKLIGVVKDGRLVERVDGLRFVDAHAQDRGAGIRLWYTSGIRNYVFVPFKDFIHYEVLQQLSSKQIEEIEREMQMAEKRAAERAAEAAAIAAAAAAGQGAAPAGEAATPPAPAGAQSEPAKDGKPAADAKAQDQQRLWFALVQQYPPDSGWSKARRDEIARRMVVVGAKPSVAEQHFVDNFGEWQKACEHFGLGVAKPADGERPAEVEDGGRRNRRSRK